MKFCFSNFPTKNVSIYLSIFPFKLKLTKPLTFRLPDERQFEEILKKIQTSVSVFLQRTEDSSASQYFQFYGYLSQQQNMMQDFVRTSTYQKAIHGNYSDFNVSAN